MHVLCGDAAARTIAAPHSPARNAPLGSLLAQAPSAATWLSVFRRAGASKRRTHISAATHPKRRDIRAGSRCVRARHPAAQQNDPTPRLACALSHARRRHQGLAARARAPDASRKPASTAFLAVCVPTRHRMSDGGARPRAMYVRDVPARRPWGACETVSGSTVPTRAAIRSLSRRLGNSSVFRHDRSTQRTCRPLNSLPPTSGSDEVVVHTVPRCPATRIYFSRPRFCAHPGRLGRFAAVPRIRKD